MSSVKPKIAVMIEEHFDQTEYRRFNEYFPQHGYDVEYVSYLWGNTALTFGSNPDSGVVEDHVTVTTDVTAVKAADYAGLLLIGAYAMDRLRYEEHVRPGQPNRAPAVQFLRDAMQAQIPVGTICHSLWLFCADRSLLAGRRVTCAHNILCDVENAGATVVYDGDVTAELVVDGNLVSGKHPGTIESFLPAFLKAVEEHRGVTV
jgi:putative intracellular protease/amidase